MLVIGSSEMPDTDCTAERGERADIEAVGVKMSLPRRSKGAGDGMAE